MPAFGFLVNLDPARYIAWPCGSVIILSLPDAPAACLTPLLLAGRPAAAKMQSQTMGTKLKNRRATEQQLGSFIQNMSVSEHMVLQIMDAEVRAIKLCHFQLGGCKEGERGREAGGERQGDEDPGVW